MNSCATLLSDCNTCPGRIVCRCLQVTEEVLLTAVRTFELRTVKEVRQHTGAGDGCTVCHRAIRQYLEQHRQQEASGAA
jgi:bacterioferritin-associated ferredoxin